MKSILVHLDASPRAAERLALARALAHRHGAELTVAYGVLPSIVASPWVATSEDGTIEALMRDIDTAQLRRARTLFDRQIGAAEARWIDATAATLASELSTLALYADLVIVGQHDAADNLCGALPVSLVPDLVVDSGKPTLAVPFAGSFDPDPHTVLLAWKPTREAARAATAALPWLRRARHVLIATADEPAEDEATPTALVHWLKLQGVGAAIERKRIVADDIGEDLLSIAADTGAGLLVMGCYGHHRAREWMLGGVTRTLLRSMTLPVLMAH